MDTPYVDAVNQPLSVGDTVAHVTRHGSSVSITRRMIVALDAGMAHLAPLSKFRSPPAETYNLVKITETK